MGSKCPLCKQLPEDTAHLVGMCGDLHQIWSLFGIKPSSPVSSSPYYKDWLARVFQNSNKQVRQLISITYWALWYRRIR